jgi:hypothetical protein
MGEVDSIWLDNNYWISDLETYIVRRDMDRDLKFTGRMIASVSTAPDQANSRYINEQIGLSLYKTRAGAFVCGRVTHILLDGERDAHEAAACNSQDAVIEFFGTDWLAKKLYDQAEIEAVEVIE